MELDIPDIPTTTVPVSNKPGMHTLRTKATMKHITLTTTLILATLAGTASLARASYTAYDLGTLGGLDSYAYGINGSGTIVGYSQIGPFSYHAFSYSGGVMHDLGTLGGQNSYAWGINSSGTVVGLAETSIGDQHAFSYSGGVMTDLGTLGGFSSGANAINSSTIVGVATSGGANHAFSYSGGVMHDLGTLGGTFSGANAINSSGTIVGDAGTSGGFQHAFSYSGGVMTDLEPYLASIGMTGLSFATALDDNGDIVGYGTLANGHYHPFLLVVPEPSAAALLALGLTALLARRRQT